MQDNTLPETYDSNFLKSHCLSILNFYDNRVIDNNGGYYQNYLDDGSYFNAGFRQLVSSTRIIVNYARAYAVFGTPEYKLKALHGLKYLQNVHWQADSQCYAWTLQDNQPVDMTQQNYGYAFVLLAYAAIERAGIKAVSAQIAHTYDLMEARFWQADYGLYADELDDEGNLSEYRGQNSNMHACEAMIAAFEATRDSKYLDRANVIAHNITVRQAALSDGLVWEHYTKQFNIDWEYNKDDPTNLYRPWGFQPGHQTEWSKLLIALYRYHPDEMKLQTAQSLFKRAFSVAWDNQHGGLIYGFDQQSNWCDDTKYFWVQAESIAAAAMLYQETGEKSYLEAYYKLWNYSWKHMIDHEYGAWFRVLTVDNQKLSSEKSIAGAKCDYHSLCACFDVLTGLN